MLVDSKRRGQTSMNKPMEVTEGSVEDVEGI